MKKEEKYIPQVKVMDRWKVRRETVARRITKEAAELIDTITPRCRAFVLTEAIKRYLQTLKADCNNCDQIFDQGYTCKKCSRHNPPKNGKLKLKR